MVQVCFCVDAVDITSFRINRGEVVFPFLVFHVHRALVCEQHRVASVTGRHDTIKHIYTSLYTFENILRRAYTHQITGLLCRENLIHHFNHLIHDLCRLAHSQSANGITVSAKVSYVLCRIATKISILASLDNGEQALVVAIYGFCLVETLPAPLQPSLGHLKTFLCILIITFSRRTLVECHHDVCADDTFCIHHVLGSEEMLAAVNM